MCACVCMRVHVWVCARVRMYKHKYINPSQLSIYQLSCHSFFYQVAFSFRARSSTGAAMPALSGREVTLHPRALERESQREGVYVCVCMHCRAEYGCTDKCSYAHTRACGFKQTPDTHSALHTLYAHLCARIRIPPKP